MANVRLCRTDEVPAGGMIKVDLADQPPLVVFNVHDDYYVTSNICTHNVAMLSDGYFEGETVECPLHGGCFNVKTGEATAFPCEKPLRTYRVTRQGEDLYIDA